MRPRSLGGAARPGARGRVRAALALALLAALALPGAARADEQPAILKAYDLDWIERVRDDAWPQPKSERPVICLLDTGVDVTPDTPADNPDGPIVARLALDGGTGLAQGTSWEHQHGTQMASIIAAPRNGYGTVGVFPQARIVSIRVTDAKQEEVYITPGAVAQGVRACARWADPRGVRVAAIAMAESNYDQRQGDVRAWADAADVAEDHGAVMVAAAGNEADADLVAPIAVPDILSMSAGDEAGLACSFVAEVSQSGAVRGPGCAASGWIAGSSASTAVASALVALLVWRASDQPPQAIRNAIVSASVAAPGSVGRLSGSAASALYAGFVREGPNLEAGAGTGAGPGIMTGAETETVDTRLWRPRVRVRWRGGRLRVVRTANFRGVLNVKLGAGAGARVVTRGGRSFSLALDKKPRLVEFWAASKSGAWRSLSSRCRL